jgi:hypothetical protein
VAVRKFTRRTCFTLTALFVLMSSEVGAQTNCACAPRQTKGEQTTRLTVAFEASVPQALREAVAAAMDTWNAWFDLNGINIGYDLVGSLPAQIIVKMDASLAGTDGDAFNRHAWDGSGEIHLNPDLASRSAAYMKSVALHEFGHSIGFDNVTTEACRNLTIMYYLMIATAPVTSLRQCDRVALQREYQPVTPPPQPGGGSTPPPTYDPCCSPIVMRKTPGAYRFSGLDRAVSFDINADGTNDLIGWTDDPDVFFLSLDRNGNGSIDDGSELFGTATPLPDGTAANGFIALSQYDSNDDGRIDSHDAIWPSLLMWSDRNHNGRTDRGELARLSTGPVRAIDLDYHHTGKHDAYGNYLRYKGRATLDTPDGKQSHPIYDVYFVAQH